MTQFQLNSRSAHHLCTDHGVFSGLGICWNHNDFGANISAACFMTSVPHAAPLLIFFAQPQHFLFFRFPVILVPAGTSRVDPLHPSVE